MAITDIRNANVTLQDPPISTNPNADLAWKAPVRAATTGSNITLSGQQTIDGVSLNVGDRVLVKDQTDQTTNGIYNVQTGPWTLTIDANNNSQVSQGLQVVVTSGTVNAQTVFQLTSANPITLGTTALVFATVVPPIFGGIVINPTTGTLNQAISVTQTVAGSASSANVNYNSISITDSTVITSGFFGNGLALTLNLNSASLQGGRQAIIGQTNINVTTSASNTNRNYVGVVGVCIANVNDNGTSPSSSGTAAGGAFGGNFVGGIGTSGATSWLNVSGAEFNARVVSGASVWAKTCAQFSADTFDRVQGSGVDTMLWFYNQSASNPGWNAIFQIDAGGGVWPLKSTGTIFKTGGFGTAASGIDISGTTFSTAAFKSNAFVVDGSGNITGGFASVASGSLTLVGSTSGSSQITVAANGVLELLSQGGGIGVGANGGSTGAFVINGATSGAVELTTPAASGGILQFGSFGSFTVNGTKAMSLGSTGPSAANASPQEWLTIADASGTTRYIPCF